MPLIACYDCNKEVSDRALSCIHCGCPLTTNSDESIITNKNTKTATLVMCNSRAGGGRIKDHETGEILSFSPYDVSDKKLLRQYVGKTVTYEKVAGKLKIHSPDNAPENPYLTEHAESATSYTASTQYTAPAKVDDERITKSYLWYLMIAVVVGGYWISKGTPNPALFFAGSAAKEECLRLANENKGSSFFIDNVDITANDTWLKDGKRVVQLLQDKNGDGINQIMCVYGNGMVQIPSMFEQGKWR
jgi:hypothetical protein